MNATLELIRNQVLVALGERKLRAEALTSFVANVVLVLQGARLSYKVDCVARIGEEDVNQLLVDATCNHEQSLTSLSIKEGIFLFLKENKKIIDGILQEEIDTIVATGKILGYAYTGPGWNYGDRYVIRFRVCLFGVVSELFTFTIPRAYYNSEHEELIKKQIASYKTILDDVWVRCFLSVRDERECVVCLF